MVFLAQNIAAFHLGPARATIPSGYCFSDSHTWLDLNSLLLTSASTCCAASAARVVAAPLCCSIAQEREGTATDASSIFYGAWQLIGLYNCVMSEDKLYTHWQFIQVPKST